MHQILDRSNGVNATASYMFRQPSGGIVKQRRKIPTEMGMHHPLDNMSVTCQQGLECAAPSPRSPRRDEGIACIASDRMPRMHKNKDDGGVLMGRQLGGIKCLVA